jgi:hypothetical protein
MRSDECSPFIQVTEGSACHCHNPLSLDAAGSEAGHNSLLEDHDQNRDRHDADESHWDRPYDDLEQGADAQGPAVHPETGLSGKGLGQYGAASTVCIPKVPIA